MRRVLIVGLVVLLAGCGGGRITSENYLKIEEGMQVDEVELILGPPDERETDSGESHPYAPFIGNIETEKLTWRSGDASITVYTFDGEVSDKSQEGLQ